MDTNNPEYLDHLASQIGDLQGQLSALTTNANDHETRIRATSALLMFAEHRRHNIVMERNDTNAREALNANLSIVAEGISKLLDDRAKIVPSDHTTVQLRSMGVNVKLSGKEGDPAFDLLAKTIDGIQAKVVELREESMRQDHAAQAAEEQHQRTLADREMTLRENEHAINNTADAAVGTTGES